MSALLIAGAIAAYLAVGVGVCIWSVRNGPAIDGWEDVVLLGAAALIAPIGVALLLPFWLIGRAIKAIAEATS